MKYLPEVIERPDRFKVSVAQFVHYQKYGYLKVESLLSSEDTKRLADWEDDMLYGREQIEGGDPVNPDAPMEELLQRLTRIHMLHRSSSTAEWGLLHPRVLDVTEALIGPDVLALQSMAFFNPPGRGGQGWHQDSYYIPTYPDTLVGAWIALERADEENGCLWVVPESNHEPIYPPLEKGTSLTHAGGAFKDLFEIEGASRLDDEANTLTQVVSKYPSPIAVPMKPGDVLFFNSHLLHRSYPNRTKDRLRRSYVCHYCNARSWVPWNHGASFEGETANDLHILARGTTHLPYAKPVFGTHVDLAKESPYISSRMMGMEDGGMMEVKQPTFTFEAPEHKSDKNPAK